MGRLKDGIDTAYILIADVSSSLIAARVGGWLGLAYGASIISFAELIYFCLRGGGLVIKKCGAW